MWALSTSAEDVAIRNRLYTRLGAARARRMLALTYPGGSARNEIRRRVLSKSESGESRGAMIGAVIDELVREMVDGSKQALKEESAGRVKELM